MFAVSLKGDLAAGPPKNACAGSLPSGVMNLSYELTTANKTANVKADQVANVNSPSAFTGLDGIGPNYAVTRATFLFLRTSTVMSIRLTFDDGAGGSTTSVVEVNGLFLIEANASKFIKLLEAQGVGAVEFFASGNQ